jgi:hypothetical protein
LQHKATVDKKMPAAPVPSAQKEQNAEAALDQMVLV